MRFAVRLSLTLAMTAMVALAASFVSSPARAAAKTILVVGDSLSAAYGLAAKDGWVTLLADRLRSERIDYSVVNGSISGETTAGGASRIDRLIRDHQPAVMILALGANDGLRGLPVAQMRANLDRMIGAAQAVKARVLLVGMRMPPNYGPKYTEEFASTFDELSRARKTALVPFLLAPIASDGNRYFQSDNLHPTASAQPLLLDVVWKELRPLLLK